MRYLLKELDRYPLGTYADVIYRQALLLRRTPNGISVLIRCSMLNVGCSMFVFILVLKARRAMEGKQCPQQQELPDEARLLTSGK